MKKQVILFLICLTFICFSLNFTVFAEEEFPENIQPPAGGLNLFDGNFLNGLVGSGGIFGVNSSYFCSTNYIPVKPSTKYTCNYTIYQISHFDKNFKFLKRPNVRYDTFTTEPDCYYIRIVFTASSAVHLSGNVMLIEGEEVLPYEPWVSLEETTESPTEPITEEPKNDTDNVDTESLQQGILVLIFGIGALAGLKLGHAFSFWKW